MKFWLVYKILSLFWYPNIFFTGRRFILYIPVQSKVVELLGTLIIVEINVISVDSNSSYKSVWKT